MQVMYISPCHGMVSPAKPVEPVRHRECWPEMRVGLGKSTRNASCVGDQHLGAARRPLRGMKSLDMAHQVWLQSLISHRIVTEVHAKALHKAAVSACSGEWPGGRDQRLKWTDWPSPQSAIDQRTTTTFSPRWQRQLALLGLKLGGQSTRATGRM